MILLLIIFLFPGFILAEEASGKALESEQAIEEKPAAESKESEQKQEKYGITGEVAASILSAYLERAGDDASWLGGSAVGDHWL